MGPQFFQTMMGKAFYEGQVPQIARSLANIATELKRANDLKEQELEPSKEVSVSDIAAEFKTGKE